MAEDGKKRALIVGAGPAGLTAAYELLKKTDICSIINTMSTEQKTSKNN